MKWASYREPDHSFGQTMLTLRTAIGLTQTKLAGFVGVSRRAVGDWEAGTKYPSGAHLKRFIALAVDHRVFPSGREPQEVRALWQAAHQKVLLDEAWLNVLLLQVESPPALHQPQETNGSPHSCPSDGWAKSGLG
jgi:transcriptional regulator with XRE-family HTH domain